MLPMFDETSADIPAGHGIDISHDGGFYPYAIDLEDGIPHYLLDGNGFDLRCSTRDEAVAKLRETCQYR